MKVTIEDLINELKKLNPDYVLNLEMTVNQLMLNIDFVKIPDRDLHIRKHVELHEAMDELLVDMMRHTMQLPSKTSVMQLMEWSYKQTLDPTETT